MKKYIINDCLKLAKDSFHRHPLLNTGNNFLHYSFIVKSNEVIGYGVNKLYPSSFPKLASYPDGSMCHSEVDAYFRNAGKIGKGSFDIINIRLNWSLQIRNSAPCCYCYNFLRSAGCNEIWFSTDCGFARYFR